MPTDIDQLVQNLKENNGELVAALVLLTSLLKRVAGESANQETKEMAEQVAAHVKTLQINRRDPPGCLLKNFEDLPPRVQELLGDRWNDFFERRNP